MKHPAGLSSLMFAFAAVVIHTYACAPLVVSAELSKWTVSSEHLTITSISMRHPLMSISHLYMVTTKTCRIKFGRAMDVVPSTLTSSLKTASCSYHLLFASFWCCSTGITMWVATVFVSILFSIVGLIHASILSVHCPEAA